MKRRIAKISVVFAICFSSAVLIFAQNEKKVSNAADSYVITAKAGGVNFVSGGVSITRQDNKTTPLARGDKADIGERVETAADGRAEILLNPGSFVRLGENSAFSFETTSLDDLRLRVERGSAIFEVLTTKDFTVEILTPRSGFFIVKSGVYRVDVNAADGTARLEVWKGKAQIVDQKMTVVKAGQTAALDAPQIAVAKFDRDEKDAFELWGRDRAKELARLNAKLRNREMNRALLAFSRNGFGWANGFGLWVNDPVTRSYCFLPFGYGWNSPYGHGFDRSIWNYQLPPNIYYNVYTNGNAPNGQQITPPPPPPASSPTFPQNGNNNGGGLATGNNPAPSGGNPDTARPPVREAQQTRDGKEFPKDQ